MGFILSHQSPPGLNMLADDPGKVEHIMTQPRLAKVPSHRGQAPIPQHRGTKEPIQLVNFWFSHYPLVN